MFPENEIPAFCSQLILVKGHANNSFKCTLQLFVKDGEEEWRPVSEVISAVAGKNGWATKKKEGDGRSPVGVYSLGEVFGYSGVKPGWMKMDYIPSDEKLFCIDDPESELYNQIASAENYPSRPWGSAENMLRQDDLYKWGIVINYNTEKPVPGLGSCIFIHVWRNAETGTEGCIAMNENNMVSLLKRLDKKKNPTIIMHT